jgi:hypothetical protein
VLYEIVNETNHNSRQFQYHMVNYIRNYEATNKPKRHPVGMTSYRDPANEPGGANSDLFTSPADYIVPGLNPYRDSPPAADGRKVIILDTDHIGGGDASWVWKAFTRGMNPIYMDTWDVSDATREGARKAMGHTLTYANKMNLAAMTPRNELAGTGYCLANPGVEYLVYQTVPGAAFTADLLAGTYDYEWFDPRSGTVNTEGSFVAAGGRCSFTAPFSGDAVFHIRKQRSRVDYSCPMVAPGQERGHEEGLCQ